ncbi:MAG: hypothetical protein J1E56_03090 [Ruminococcus sp.]|nr:hypothetical protein [Ruminococcus sp.]
MFGIGDVVVYGSQGVCKITAIDEKKFNREIKKYFVLKPVYDDRNTIFVPLDNPLLYSRLYSVLTEAEMTVLIDNIPNEELLWFENELERKAQYKKVMSEGNRNNVSRIIKTLRQHRSKQQQAGKKLHSSDEYVLKEAEKLLFDEIAFIFNLEPQNVVPFIEEKIGAVS